MTEKDPQFKDNSPLLHEMLDQEDIFPARHFNETFRARAIIRSRFAKTLMEHPVGQFLVQNGICTHPILKEKDRQMATLQKLLSNYEQSGLLEDRDDLEAVVYTEPDLMPTDFAHIAVEAGVQRTIVDSLEYKLSMNTFDQLDEVSYKTGFPPDMDFYTDGSELADQAADAVRDMQDIANDLYYRRVRDKVLDLAIKENWAGIIEMSYHMHFIPELRTAFAGVLQVTGKKLFANPDFRKQMTYFMIRQISVNNISGQESFSEFLLANGFAEITEAEKKVFLDHAYQGRLLENMLYLNPKKYFHLVETLYRYGLITDEFLRSSPIFRLHVIEFALKALYGHDDFVVLVNTVRPLVAEMGVFQPEELTISNQYSLYGHYRTLCSTLNKKGDQVIAKLFPRDHAKKWEE